MPNPVAPPTKVPPSPAAPAPGRVWAFNIATGERAAVWPVDAREYFATGGWAPARAAAIDGGAIVHGSLEEIAALVAAGSHEYLAADYRGAQEGEAR